MDRVMPSKRCRRRRPGARPRSDWPRLPERPTSDIQNSSLHSAALAHARQNNERRGAACRLCARAAAPEKRSGLKRTKTEDLIRSSTRVQSPAIRIEPFLCAVVITVPRACVYGKPAGGRRMVVLRHVACRIGGCDSAACKRAAPRRSIGALKLRGSHRPASN